MKRKNKKISPGQLTIFDRVIYSGRCYTSLKQAMIKALQDFYMRKLLPAEITTAEKVYKLKDMKRFWRLYDLHDLYVC